MGKRIPAAQRARRTDGTFLPNREASPKTAIRYDGWENRFTGASIRGQDKLVHGHFFYEPLDPYTLEQLYYGFDLANRIVHQVVYDAMRQGYKVTLPGERQGDVDRCLERAHELRLDYKVERLLWWARLYGGAGMMLGIQDGLPFAEPAIPEQGYGLQYVRPVDRRYAFSVFWDENPFSDWYGEPAVWMVGSYTGPFAYVHRTRFIPVRGYDTDEVTRRRLQGWGFPVLQPVYDALRNLGQAEHAAVQALVDMNLDVFKLHGLVQSVASDTADDMQHRMHIVDMQKNTGRSILVDRDLEDFDRKGVTIPAGIGPVLEHMLYRISAAAAMPVSVLFGRSPAGMNATGDMDVRMWYDRVKAYQEGQLKPILMRIYELIGEALGLGMTGLDITFPTLYQPTDGERADVEVKTSQKDQIYHDLGVLTADEIRQSRYGEGKFSQDTKIDPELAAAEDLAEQTDPVELATATAKAKADPFDQGPPKAVAQKEDFVRKRGNKWVVLSESGKLLGEHDSKEEAEAQLRAIEAHKHG